MAPRSVPNIMRQGKYVPWLYLLPALLIMSMFIVYPMLNTISLSFKDRSGVESAATTCVAGNPCWGVFENYRIALTAEFDTRTFATFWSSFWLSSYGNTLKWIVLMVSGTVGLGLVFAVLADRVKYEALAKAIIFMPMAVSFVGAGIIWKFVYDFRGPGREQIGALNALVTALGGEPQAWIAMPGWNNLLLMVILIWIQTGFAMVILSAALRGIPEETLAAARVDGANEIQIFFRVMVPQIMGTILVVWTTITIVVLKVFDIVLAMTNGQWGTEVLANLMYNWMFRGGGDFGRGSMIAVVIMVAVIPVMLWNIRRYRAEEANQ